jgi:hypothetical protein
VSRGTRKATIRKVIGVCRWEGEFRLSAGTEGTSTRTGRSRVVVLAPWRGRIGRVLTLPLDPEERASIAADIDHIQALLADTG